MLTKHLVGSVGPGRSWKAKLKLWNNSSGNKPVVCPIFVRRAVVRGYAGPKEGCEGHLSTSKSKGVLLKVRNKEVNIYAIEWSDMHVKEGNDIERS